MSSETMQTLKRAEAKKVLGLPLTPKEKSIILLYGKQSKK